MKKIVLVFVLISFFTKAQNIHLNKIDSLFETQITATSPGAIVAVYKKGEIVYSKGFGLADLNTKSVINKNSKFRIGSTSKQFTAACILILIEQGKLEYNNKLSDFYPQFPDYAKQITIKQLLNHTSGIRDYPSIALFKGLLNEVYDDEMVLDWLTKQKQLNFKTGEEFQYSNSNYWLLGKIVEKVSGINLAEFAKENLFLPLAMNDTHFHNNRAHTFENRVLGYKYIGNNSFENKETKLELIGDGGLYTTINDLAKWDHMFYNNIAYLHTEDLLKKGKLNSGKEINYAAGLFVSSYKGLKTVSHSGVVEGFKSQLLRFIDEGISIVVLANRNDINAVDVAKQIANIIFVEKFDNKTKKPKITAQPKPNFTLENLELKNAVGYYEIQPAVGYKITIKNNDTLQALQTWNNIAYPLVNIEKNKFQNPDDSSVAYIFTNLKQNIPTKLVLVQENSQPTFERKVFNELTLQEITNYVGNYYSEELNETYHVILNQNALSIKVRNNNPIPLIYTGENKFSYLLSTLTFKKENKRVKSFNLNAGRLNNIQFIKM